ncbi:PPE family protein, SVP subgroup [Mycobacterium attenuatum]|uniref:PPE family protein, SVP subgroup n=1 Tax=Mycobacterium attenuatum TaxID=2341086 RepID=UPI0024530903|nr:hypothetical protein [Mycobacterium attenuatum]
MPSGRPDHEYSTLHAPSKPPPHTRYGGITLIAAKTFQATTLLTTRPTSGAAPAAMPGPPGMRSATTGRAGVVPRYGLRMTVMSRPLSGG